MIKAVVRVFAKQFVRSAASTAVVVGTFLVGREVGRMDMGKTIIKPTKYGTLTVDKDGNNPGYKFYDESVRSIDE